MEEWMYGLKSLRDFFVEWLNGLIVQWFNVFFTLRKI